MPAQDLGVLPPVVRRGDVVQRSVAVLGGVPPDDGLGPLARLPKVSKARTGNRRCFFSERDTFSMLGLSLLTPGRLCEIAAANPLRQACTACARVVGPLSECTVGVPGTIPCLSNARVNSTPACAASC